MRVQVDDARHQRQPAGIDNLGRVVANLTDRSDAAILGCNVSTDRIMPESIHHRGAADHEVMHRHPPARLPEFYGDILCWSSDVYHHDGDDVWRAIERMQRHGLPREDQAKFLVANARRLYKVQASANIIRERVTEIERTDWWPTDEEVRAALRPEAAVTRG
jgi:hypothetical protein